MPQPNSCRTAAAAAARVHVLLLPIVQHQAAIVVAADSTLVDVWVEDCASAMTQMHLMADALGIGSCWLQVRLRKTPDGSRDTQDVVREVLGIPDKFSIMAILCLGTPVSHPGARTIDMLDLSKIHHEHF